MILACVRVQEGIHAVPSQPLAVQFVHARTPLLFEGWSIQSSQKSNGGRRSHPPKRRTA
jgi:hypothetical protein